METLMYRGYKIILPIKNNGRIYINGFAISCTQHWYSIKKVKEFIDYTIKYTVPFMRALRNEACLLRKEKDDALRRSITV